MSKATFAIDRGGTFTDIVALVPPSRVETLKLLSVAPEYDDAPTEGIRRLLFTLFQIDVARGTPLPTDMIEEIRMGTTVATNALLERQGEPMAFVVSKGFRDILHIGTQARPAIFDLRVACPDVLYERVIEVDERVTLLARDERTPLSAADTVQGLTGELLRVERSIGACEASLREDLQLAYTSGIRSIAVAFVHSYTFPDHERHVERIARDIGFTQVSLSSALMPMVKIVPRGYTACADAYLTPCLVRYINGFLEGFDSPASLRVSFMQSDGGLTSVDSFSGSRAILSGPAGGVVGFAQTTMTTTTTTATTSSSSSFPVSVSTGQAAADTADGGVAGNGLLLGSQRRCVRPQQGIIGFDMGGTSTDVSRFDPSLSSVGAAQQYEHEFESVTAGVTIQAPQLAIRTVAAGGGSRLYIRSGAFAVGPGSAGAFPGPACYRRNGPATVTDANVVLGRVRPEFFPSCFGPNECEPIDATAAHAALAELTREINAHESTQGRLWTVPEVALGFVRVANEAMSRPIRSLTQSKGHDSSTHILACFGGAGGQHACAVARVLGMRRVFIHRHSGLLSAVGLALADIAVDMQEPCAAVRLSDDEPAARDTFVRLAQLVERARAQLAHKVGVQLDAVDTTTSVFLNLRYARTDVALMVMHPACIIPLGDRPTQALIETFRSEFLHEYAREHGFTCANRDILIDDIRVRVTGGARADMLLHNRSDVHSSSATLTLSAPSVREPLDPVPIYFAEHSAPVMTPVYTLSELSRSNCIVGPALLIDTNATVVVEPDCTVIVLPNGDLEILLGDGAPVALSTQLDAVQLSVFGHRFMSIAEQAGRQMQRTSISTNIKERLDFSLAIFGPDGALVANAPHIPVHLGAMQEAVRFQIRHVGIAAMADGDVFVSNHPCAGGSHLPDITVITPVFADSPKPVFFVAARGHHADIGGSTPGSMPPHSKSLLEEGARITSFRLVRAGHFDEEGITRLLVEQPARVPGCTGTRALRDNIADLHAAISACHKGITLVNELVKQYTLQVVHAYMEHIQANAECAVRDLLRSVVAARRRRFPSASAVECATLRAADCMDDGTPICVTITIDADSGSAHFDFSGTGPEVLGNCNAPPAVTYSAVIYALRCMVGHDIPLNQGCLHPIRFTIPPHTILNPRRSAAVVGGNVLTSQRVVDVVLRAFNACAAAQGCMNNLTFGDASFGYYETIAGGAGAGDGWHGRSGVHTHMTNTRITDIEIMERRYPVIMRAFHLRDGSGGTGRFRGGDGVVRELEFTRNNITVSVLSERRVVAPFGLEGGGSGACGLNLVQMAPMPPVSTSSDHNGEENWGEVPQDGALSVEGSDDTPMWINVGAKCQLNVTSGSRLRLLTPGGGAYGAIGAQSLK